MLAAYLAFVLARIRLDAVHLNSAGNAETGTFERRLPTPSDLNQAFRRDVPMNDKLLHGDNRLCPPVPLLACIQGAIEDDQTIREVVRQDKIWCSNRSLG